MLKKDKKNSSFYAEDNSPGDDDQVSNREPNSGSERKSTRDRLDKVNAFIDTFSHTRPLVSSLSDFNRRIIENSADCIKVLDLQGNLLSMNLPGCKSFEIEDFSPYFGKSYSTFWRDGAYEESQLAIETAKQGGTGRFQGFCPTAKGTPKWWDVLITPIYNDDGVVDKLLAISRDITSFKDFEQRQEDFLSATSHELKTPLTSQKAFIQLLEMEVNKSENSKLKNYVEKVSEQNEKLTKLVNDLLDASKIQSGQLKMNKEAFYLADSIKDLLKEMKTFSYQHHIFVKGHLDKKVFGDEDRICQVLSNLLINAIKYSPNSDEVHISLKEQDDKAVVRVTDFGIGIDEKNQTRIFERFFRVTEEEEKTFPGLGMGLYIASEIIRQHGSRILVKSTKGNGSTFSFSLPLA